MLFVLIHEHAYPLELNMDRAFSNVNPRLLLSLDDDRADSTSQKALSLPTWDVSQHLQSYDQINSRTLSQDFCGSLARKWVPVRRALLTLDISGSAISATHAPYVRPRQYWSRTQKDIGQLRWMIFDRLFDSSTAENETLYAISTENFLHDIC